MKCIRHALLLWAAREHLARPGAALLMGVALGALTILLTTGLLLSQALTASTNHLLAAGPDLVIRRVDPHGWRPIAVDAVQTALAIPGVTDARARVWGTASSPEGAVTVIAVDHAAPGFCGFLDSLTLPAPGEAVLGGGVASPGGDDRLVLRAAGTVEVGGHVRFPAETDLATHDLVLLHPRDARRLLGLAPGSASDLALTVFHPEEAEALRPELARAFPWPVHSVTREETRKHYAAAFGRRGGLAAVLYLPAAVALVLLVTVIVRQQIGGRRRVGLLKALGWTSRDIVALQLSKALLVGAPAVATGMMIAYGLVYGVSPRWVGHLLLGWPQAGPFLPLAAGLAGSVFLEVAGLLLVPYLAAVLWSSLAQAAADPQELLRREP